MRSDQIKELRAALEASPSKIVLIVTRDHQDNTPGSWHASKIKLPDGTPGWDHVAVAWADKHGNPVFAEKTPGKGLGPVGSANKSGTEGLLVTEYTTIEIIPIDLSRFGAGAREKFINTFLEAFSAPYSAIAKIGDHCSSAFGKALAAAMDQSTAPAWLKSIVKDLIKNILPVNLYTPNDAYLHGKQLTVPFRFDPDSPTQGQTIKNDWMYPPQAGQGAVKRQPVASSADDNAASLAALAGAIGTLSDEARASLSDEARASLLASTDGEQGASPSEKLATLSEKPATPSDTKDARTDDDPQQPATDDDEGVSTDEDEDASPEQVALTSNPEDARTEQVALALETEDARTDDAAQQPATDDDDEEPLQADDDEELADASDNEDAPTADALMQTAKAEAGADATADGQAGPQLATSVPVTADDGFSFSLFPKPKVPTEVAKEVLPAEQTSPVEQSSIPGVPGSESAHPDLDSANVGNAAPGHERVVHHGDLAP
jgi:hypothetical protein